MNAGRVSSFEPRARPDDDTGTEIIEPPRGAPSLHEVGRVSRIVYRVDRHTTRRVCAFIHPSERVTPHAARLHEKYKVHKISLLRR